MRTLTPITLQEVSFAFAETPVLDRFSLHIEPGRIVALLGPSGCGKSTLLRLLAGLSVPASGEIRFGDRLVARAGWGLPPEQRDIGMVFQDYALWPHMSVAQNVALPLKMAGVPAGERQRRVSEMLELVGLSALRDSYPARLSGGQKQRTGIARALVTQPEILLCDEATSALDPENTLSVLTLLKEINQRLGLTIVLITHEMEVIRTLCDRVSVLEGGRIVEQGDVWRVFGNPQHPVTRAMLGLQHPDRPEAGPPLRDGEQIVTLRFDGSSGREPNLQHIASLLGGDARLLYSNCERIQGRVIGQLQVRLSGPLAASALAQDGWVADSILTHHHQTAETTAS